MRHAEQHPTVASQAQRPRSRHGCAGQAHGRAVPCRAASRKEGRQVMDPEIRAAAIDTIKDYIRIIDGGDPMMPEMIGFAATRTDVTDEMEAAMVDAVLPMLSDERINFLMRHIAEVLVNAKLETTTEVR